MFVSSGGTSDMVATQTSVIVCQLRDVSGYEKVLVSGNFALAALPAETYIVTCKIEWASNVTNDPIRLLVSISGFPVDAVVGSIRNTNWRCEVTIAGIATYDVELWTFNTTLYSYTNLVNSTSTTHDCSTGTEPTWTNLVTGATYTTTLRFYQG